MQCPCCGGKTVGIEMCFDIKIVPKGVVQCVDCEEIFLTFTILGKDDLMVRHSEVAAPHLNFDEFVRSKMAGRTAAKAV